MLQTSYSSRNSLGFVNNSLNGTCGASPDGRAFYFDGQTIRYIETVKVDVSAYGIIVMDFLMFVSYLVAGNCRTSSSSVGLWLGIGDEDYKLYESFPAQTWTRYTSNTTLTKRPTEMTFKWYQTGTSLKTSIGDWGLDSIKISGIECVLDIYR